MIFCNRVVEEFYCQQCGNKLKKHLMIPYQQYGVYMCSSKCFTSFKRAGRLDHWIRLIGRSRNAEGRRDYVATR